MSNMRLKMSMASANEAMIGMENRGYGILAAVEQDYQERKQAKTYNGETDMVRYREQINGWGEEVFIGLSGIFPTELEMHLFANPPVPGLRGVSGDHEFQSLLLRLCDLLRNL